MLFIPFKLFVFRIIFIDFLHSVFFLLKKLDTPDGV